VAIEVAKLPANYGALWDHSLLDHRLNSLS
jgi:hypothetical protein